MGHDVMHYQCSECGAEATDDQTCRDYFDQMLYWENEDPARGIVHHLMVLCYHLQHPGLYSAEGLAVGKQLLADFVERGLEPQQVRRNNRGRVDSSRRDWSITARPGNHGAYEQPLVWAMTAADVVAGGPAGYVENVRAWAEATQTDLRRMSIDR